MLIGSKSFVGPLVGVMLGEHYIKRVHSTRCLGMEVDEDLKWVKHVSELMQSFSQKLNLLKSLYFLPIRARLDFYYKVVLPSVTYGLVVWGSRNKTQFDNLERMHIRAAKIIFGLDWNTPTDLVRTKYNWITLKTKHLKSLATLVYKCDQGDAPVPVQELFVKRTRTYNLRKENCLSLPRPRTEIMKKSIVYKGSVLWNNLSNECRKAKSLDSFKFALRCEYLNDEMFD